MLLDQASDLDSVSPCNRSHFHSDSAFSNVHVASVCVLLHMAP